MMKKLAPFALFIGIAAFAQGQGKTVPPAVESAFGNQYAGAQVSRWTEEDGVWEGSFVQNGMEADAQFSATGKWIKSEFQVPADKVPAQVTQSLNQNYAHYQLEEVSMLEAAGEGRHFEVDIVAEGNDVQLLMDETGKIISSEVERSDND